MDLLTLLTALTVQKEALYAKIDERVNEVKSLQQTLGDHPAASYAASFLSASKSSGIEPTILAGIAKAESSLFERDSCRWSGGANGFGYDSNKTCFTDYKESIHKTAEVLEGYKSTTLEEKLCVWQSGKPQNGECGYAQRVKEFANQFETIFNRLMIGGEKK